jgi:ribosome-binding factor A
MQRILGEVFRARVRDPRLRDVIVTAVKASRDISVARVYYTTLVQSDTELDLTDAIGKATGFIRSQLAAELNVRQVPELRFIADDTGTRGDAMEQLIDEAVGRDRAGPDRNGE